MGHVLDREPEAGFEIWVATSLDLMDPSQPAHIVPVDADGRFEATVGIDGRYWIFLREWLRPEGGPPMELFLPLDLRGHLGEPERAIQLRAIHPRKLMTRERLSLSWPVLTRLLLVVAVIGGGGLFALRRLRPLAGPPGLPSAPWAALFPSPPTKVFEFWVVAVCTLVATAVRLPALRSEAFDLLEVSYLPGIGRPNPFAEGLSGWPALVAVVRELVELWCLDLVHPPLYHAVMGFMGLLGPDEWWLRLPAFVASLLVLVLTWRVVRRFSVGAGLLSAAVLAVAPASIYWGQDATPYAAVALSVMLAVVGTQRALETGRGAPWHMAFVALYAGFLCHYNVALVGVGIGAAVGVVAILGRRDPRWPGALAGAIRAALLWSPIPIFWTWFHFSTFPTVAQDTRLFADTFEPNPGLPAFARDFGNVLGGMLVDPAPISEVGLAVLLVLGLVRVLRAPLGVAILQGALLVAFFGSVLFFHQNLVHHLNGRVYYGFRWVSWYHPALVALLALGAVAGPGPAILRRASALAWLLGVGAAARQEIGEVARPDYAAIARIVAQELDDRDAVATLPTWFQRGNVSHYLMDGRRVGRAPDEGEGMWLVDGKKVTLEPVHAGLPFETTLRNAHVGRMWLAVVDERSFGRVKWMEEVSRGGKAWADRTMDLDKSWTMGRVRLYRYRARRADLELDKGEVVDLDAGDVVLNSRTYPRLPGPVRFRDPGPPSRTRLGATLRYQSPMTPGCVDWSWTHLDESLEPDAPNHWYLDAMVPLSAGSPLPDVEKVGPAQVHIRREGDTVRITAVGGPCSGPSLRLQVRGR